MSDIFGNLKGITNSDQRNLKKLISRKLNKTEIISDFLAKELISYSIKLKRILGVLIDRNGNIHTLVVGDRQIMYLPDLGRHRVSGRLRGLRLIFTDLGKQLDPKITQDIYTDLEKLRLDLVVVLKNSAGGILTKLAHLKFENNLLVSDTKEVGKLSDLPDVAEITEAVEAELEIIKSNRKPNRAILVGIYDSGKNVDLYMEELVGLATASGIDVASQIVQKRKSDRHLIGKGKIEELSLLALKHDAEMVIFDGELNPSTWRHITNATDLKVLDRSMLILDIFARRATSAVGRAQVELAQLKYNLPKLVDTDSGLSRLSGGIGGRGPGQTKLEVSRKYFRTRIKQLEDDIEKSRLHYRTLGERRKKQGTLQISLVGYTNAGKSTLFNILTKSNAFVADQLFATLDTVKRKIFLQDLEQEVVIADSVGFIRELPEELITAFRATLDDLNDANLLLQVIDVSDPNYELQITSVKNVLNDLGLSNTPVIFVYNKVDQIEDVPDGGIAISAKTGEGIDLLKTEILSKIAETSK